ncbi:SdpI family protein [Holtiella tumoricola]
METFLLICNLLIPLMMLGFGIMFEKNPPKNINGVYGYRTSMSMKNQDIWNFAHQYCGKVWRTWGLMILIVSIFFTIISYFLGEAVQGIICSGLVVVQTIILIVSIIPVEKALKRTFDKNGKKYN